MKKINFLVVFFFLTGQALWATLDVRLGASASFSSLDLGRIGRASANLHSGATEEEVADLHKVINSAKAGVQHNLYTQVGFSWDIFQAGGELAFGFNAFSNVKNESQWSSLMGFSPRAYFGFDLFLARLTLLAGTTINFQVGQVALPKNYSSPKVDLGFRVSVGPLIAEFIGAINAVEFSLSAFRIGLGLEFTILGG